MEKHIKNWLEHAQSDLAAAHNSLKSKNFDWACFQAQQAVEKGLKAVYIKIHNRLFKIHDLVKLAREIKAPPGVIEKCSKINPVYFEVRYPEGDELPAEKISEQKTKELIILAEEVLLWVKKNL